MHDSNTLPAIIQHRIAQEGPLTFRDFMEMALYHPDLGYYNSSRPKIGEDGDFYTSGNLTGLFSELLACQLEEMWQALGRRTFTIVEYGAGTGLLCRDILCRLKENAEMYEKLNYFIIEKSEVMREHERRNLPDKVQWKGSIREIGPITGCIFSNELVDNFSVHRVVMADELMEICVGHDGDFIEALRPAPEMLKDYLIRMNVELPRGYHAEINLEATKWIQEVGEALQHGWVMTIDYGFPAAILYSKRSGTLACYYRHTAHFSPYQHIGEQDITAHVNFSALDYWGRNAGLSLAGYANQTRFLQGLGLAARLRKHEENGMGVSERQRLRAFLLEMGPKFKVLIQHKGVGAVFLSGLAFPDYLLG